MLFLENQHGPQPDRPLSTPTNIDTLALCLFQHLIPSHIIKRNKSALTLSSQILNLLGEPLTQPLETVKEVVTNGSSAIDKIHAFDFLNDGTEEDRARRITHPSVELTVRLVGTEIVVAKVITSCLRLLGKGNHVRWRAQTPVFVGPEFPSCTDTGLHFVDDEEDVVFLGDFAEAAEEVWCGVVVAAFGLDGFDDYGGGWVVEGGDDVSCCVQTSLLFCCIFCLVFMEGVLEDWEGGLWPVKGGDVELVDGFRACG